jgi:MFS family permease
LTRFRSLVPELPRAAWVVLGGHALSAVGTGLTLPFFLVYLHAVRGIDLRLAGLILATIPFASLVGNPVGGALADWIGPRNTVVLGLMTSAVGAVTVTGVSGTWHGLAAAALVGLGAAVTWPAQDALLATVVRPDQRSAAFAFRLATLNAGFGVGALVAATIVDFSSPGSFVLLYALDAVSFLAFVPILLLLVPKGGRGGGGGREATAGRGGYARVLRDRVFVRVWALAALVVAVSYGQYHSSFPGYATGTGGISASALSLAFAANTLTVVAAQLLVLKLVTGRRRTRAVMLACGCWAATWAATLAAGQLGGDAAVAGFVLAMAIFAVGETLLAPTLPAIVNDLAIEELRGRYNGLSTLAWTVGFMIGPVIAGFSLSAGRASALFGSLVGACGLAALAALRLERHLPAEANFVSRVSIAEPPGDGPPAASPTASKETTG